MTKIGRRHGCLQASPGSLFHVLPSLRSPHYPYVIHIPYFSSSIPIRLIYLVAVNSVLTFTMSQ